MLPLIDSLIRADQTNPKRIAVVGDAMTDVWVFGHTRECQESCLKFVEESRETVPGGAGNAHNQLRNWNSTAELFCSWGNLPVKERMVVGDKVVFRRDRETFVDSSAWYKERARALARLREVRWDGILVSDYDKGFIDDDLMKKVVAISGHRNCPIVSDAKRPPEFYSGTTIKMNEAYYRRYHVEDREIDWDAYEGVVVTEGPDQPRLGGRDLRYVSRLHWQPVRCVNPIGAGDCFAVHLVLALAHGFALEEATLIAHAAGRVYVQHPLERPPWPHEIRKDFDPVGGKVVGPFLLQALRRSTPGRVVFTNGVFRLPHAGHSWFLDWAKRQGDVLVVGVNSDASAAANRETSVLPLAERVQMLAGHQAVDWVTVFEEDTPEEILSQLRPHVLVKGHEYAGCAIPGHQYAKEVRFAPPSPFAGHSTHLVELIKESW